MTGDEDGDWEIVRPPHAAQPATGAGNPPERTGFPVFPPLPGSPPARYPFPATRGFLLPRECPAQGVPQRISRFFVYPHVIPMKLPVIPRDERLSTASSTAVSTAPGITLAIRAIPARP